MPRDQFYPGPPQVYWSEENLLSEDYTLLFNDKWQEIFYIPRLDIPKPLITPLWTTVVGGGRQSGQLLVRASSVQEHFCHVNCINFENYQLV